MTAWPLEPLTSLRSAQALRAAREASHRRSDADRARLEADGIALRAREERRRAVADHGIADAAPAGELEHGAASRAGADDRARRMLREGLLAAERAEGARVRAVQAAAAQRELEGRAGALSRGAERWAEQGRRAREAAREREIEDAWAGRRGRAGRTS